MPRRRRRRASRRPPSRAPRRPHWRAPRAPLRRRRRRAARRARRRRRGAAPVRATAPSPARVAAARGREDRLLPCAAVAAPPQAERGPVRALALRRALPALLVAAAVAELLREA